VSKHPEFTNTSDLRAEVEELETTAEEMAEQMAEFHRRREVLEEKVGVSPFGTRAIAEAAATVSDATTLEEAQEALAELRRAVDEPDALADVATGVEAIGDVDAFTADAAPGQDLPPAEESAAATPTLIVQEAPDGWSAQVGQVDSGDRAGRPRPAAPLIRDEPAWLFADVGGRPAARWLRVWQTSPGRVVAVVTEQPDDTGPSITNVIEAVAAQLRAEHPGQEVQVVEHYLPRPQSRHDGGGYERWTLTAITEDGVDQIELPPGGRTDLHRQPRPGHLRSPRPAALAADHPHRPGSAHRPPSPGRGRRPPGAGKVTVQTATSAPDGPRPGCSPAEQRNPGSKDSACSAWRRQGVPLWLLDGRHV
jgi:hypothetical protein